MVVFRLSAACLLALASLSAVASVPLNEQHFSKLPAYYYPQHSFTTTPAFKASSSDPAQIAREFIQSKLDLDSLDSSVEVTAEYKDPNNGATVVHATQLKNGKAFANSHVSVVVSKEGKVLSWGSSWFDDAAAKKKKLVKRARNDEDEEDEDEEEEVAEELDAEEEDFAAEAIADTPTVSAIDAVVAFVHTIGDKSFKAKKLKSTGAEDSPSITGVPGALSPVEPKLKYYQTKDKTAELVWSFAVEMEDAWPSVIVSATTGQVLGANDWVSNSMIPLHNPYSHLSKRETSNRLTCRAKRNRLARRETGLSRRAASNRLTCHSKSGLTRRTGGSRAYFARSVSDIVREHALSPAAPVQNSLNRRAIQKTTWSVVPLGQVSVEDGLKTVVSPEDEKFSPVGWNDFNNGRGAQSTTAGNNVIAVSNPQDANNVINNQRANGNSNFVFNFAVDDTRQEPPEYVDASITNMFFVSNAAHDLFYAYGFTEATGNFQFDNFGKGGKGNDPVVASAQDGSGTNNANFATPPDGTPGRMRMFVFTLTNPGRDGALENPIVLHELGHGVSNRLVGGNANANCLTTVESVGLGEGWSDFFGVLPVIKSTDTRALNIGVGTYVTNSAKGVRTQQYSTSTAVNKNTYSSIRTSGSLDNQDVHFIGEVFMEMLYEAYWNVVDKLGASDNLKDDVKSGKGNTVLMQIVMDSLKLLPCNPTVIDARDAILLADKEFNGGKLKCEIQAGFAKRGLGFNIKAGDTTFEDDFTVDPTC
ncbi:Fungalysin metallopeptidase-domain-containing protein [Cladochytrium replicatum]|nr:Fungalysin metallopeptidase-domain-containing protein [Cladochytrium replicatum]